MVFTYQIFVFQCCKRFFKRFVWLFILCISGCTIYVVFRNGFYPLTATWLYVLPGPFINKLYGLSTPFRKLHALHFFLCQVLYVRAYAQFGL